MDASGIKDVLRAMGHVKDTKLEGEWVMTTCPLAPWRHLGGQDSSPSFGVHVSNDDVSIYNCFTCKSKGRLSRLLQLMESYTGDNHHDLIQEIDSNELYMSIMPEWDLLDSSRRTKMPDPVDEHMLSIYPLATADHPYLIEREIDEPETIEALGLRIDPDNKGVERLLFPVWHTDGNLYGFTGRATNDIAIPKVRDYFGLPKGLLLLGAHDVDPTKPLLVVEGLLDYAMMRQYGYQCVAVMHSSITEHQARILMDIGAPIYLFLDNDKAGKGGMVQIADALREYVPVWKVEYPEDVNDPALLFEDEVENMINEATLA